MKLLTVGLLCGGQSVEHEVSLLSAASIFQALNKKKYRVILMGINREGQLVVPKEGDAFLNRVSQSPDSQISINGEPSYFLPQTTSSTSLITPTPTSPHTLSQPIDVIFPIIHGNTGEDGAVQGLLKLANMPYVGSDILGCAITMDKAICKQLLCSAGLPTAHYFSLAGSEIITSLTPEYIRKIMEHIGGYPCFVKPANSGSSVGISKVYRQDDLIPAIQDAFLYDDKVIIEEYIEGRELECGVLGHTHQPQASLVGEIITDHDFYSYKAKYLDNDSLVLDIPANNLSSAEVKCIQEYAIQAFQQLSCCGMARVDFFMDKQRRIFINELNTFPGFTKVSMYPMLWKASGLSYSDLLDKLIQLAIEKHERNSQFLRHYQPLLEAPVSKDLED